MPNSGSPEGIVPTMSTPLFARFKNFSQRMPRTTVIKAVGSFLPNLEIARIRTIAESPTAMVVPLICGANSRKSENI